MTPFDFITYFSGVNYTLCELEDEFTRARSKENVRFLFGNELFHSFLFFLIPPHGTQRSMIELVWTPEQKERERERERMTNSQTVNCGWLSLLCGYLIHLKTADKTLR